MQSNKSITAILIGSIILLIVLILSIIIIHFKTPTKEEPKSLYTDKAINVMKELSAITLKL